jgi:hypothetical protein
VLQSRCQPNEDVAVSGGGKIYFRSSARGYDEHIFATANDRVWPTLLRPTPIDQAVSWSSTSLNQRFALSHTRDGWNLTANIICGTQLDSVTNRPQISPCPAPFSFNGCSPDFINVDLTATRPPSCLPSISLALDRQQPRRAGKL